MCERKRKGTRERQKQIIDISLKVIDKEGIQGLTLKRIASEIGISDVALLRHFSSKEEILEALAQKVFFENVVTEEEGWSEDVLSSLRSLTKRQFEAFEQCPQATAVLFQEEIFREYPKIREWFIRRRSERHAKIVNMVLKGQSTGRISPSVDPSAFATIYMGAIRMTVMEWRDSGYVWSLVDRSGPLVDMLLRVLR
ncbi:MAG: TetR/AcrR family transcriptional regulator [Methanomassiliicoccales archaeon]|nr:MAG: TetR/AcrR family transcriptional regulator [Methanomassiliicoccales archaeon]